MTNIPFNKPFLTGRETTYIKDAVATGKISGDGVFTAKCHAFFEKRYGFKKCLLTTSCTDALEMAAILLDIKPGDEIIIPSFTFVSTANAFVLRGAKIIFADSRKDHPGVDEDRLEALITPKTKAIVPVHYAGVACDMEKIMQLADKYNLFVVEDAAQAIDSYFTFSDNTRKPLGGIGHLAAFSFHETKNIIAGEGGMIVINDERFIERAEIIREKGTNRSKFYRGEVDKYGWVDIGSSFLPSEIIAAFLYAQLETLDEIQHRRKQIWNRYYEVLKNNPEFDVPVIPDSCDNNAHMFYLLCRSLPAREQLIAKLKAKGIQAVFHYLSLHSSPYFKPQHNGRSLSEADRYSNQLVRLPLFFQLTDSELERITTEILS